MISRIFQEEPELELRALFFLVGRVGFLTFSNCAWRKNCSEQ